MSKRRMLGFLDPISLGFILALAGTSLALSTAPATHKAGAQSTASAQQVVQTQLAKRN